MLTFSNSIEDVYLPHCFGDVNHYDPVCLRCGFKIDCNKKRYGDTTPKEKEKRRRR